MLGGPDAGVDVPRRRVPAAAYLKFGVQVTSGQRDAQVDRDAGPLLRVEHGVSRRQPGGTSERRRSCVFDVGGGADGVDCLPVRRVHRRRCRVTTTGDRRSASSNEPELDRVLASTSFLIDMSTGELLESDIFFNCAFPWSVAPAGEAGRYDLEIDRAARNRASQRPRAFGARRNRDRARPAAGACWRPRP